MTAWAQSPAQTAPPLAKELMQALKKSMKAPPSTVMVTPFRLPAGDALAAQFVSELLRALKVSEGVNVVDEVSVKAALNEAALGEGAVDGVLTDVAGAFGAQALVSGSIDKQEGSYFVNVRAIVVATGVVVASAKATFGVTSERAGIEANTLAAQLRRLADRVAHGLDQADGDLRYQQVAVLPFEEMGTQTQEKQLGLLVAAELTTSLRRDHNLLVVERSQLNKVIEELSLGQTGLTDPNKTAEVGKLAGAQLLVMGTVAEAGDRYSVNARVISVTDGQVKAAEQVDLPAADLVSLSSEAVVLRTKSGAIYRSLLMPGWGQFYNREPIKGAAFVGAEVLTAGLALTFHLLGQGYASKYDKMTPPSDTQVDIDNMWDKQTTAYSRRNLLLIGLLVVHAVNILDATISGKSYDSAAPGGSSSFGLSF